MVTSHPDFPRWPKWKYHLWSKISFDARTRKVFPPGHFREHDGLMRPELDDFRFLYERVGMLEREEKGLAATWVYGMRGRWMLRFADPDEYVRVRYLHGGGELALKVAQGSYRLIERLVICGNDPDKTRSILSEVEDGDEPDGVVKIVEGVRSIEIE